MPKQPNFLAKTASVFTSLFSKSTLSATAAPKDPQGIAFESDVFTLLQSGADRQAKRPSLIPFKALKDLSRTLPIVGVCKDTLKHQVTKVRWDLVPVDKQKPNPEHMDKVFRLLSHPNRNRESFRTLMDKLIDDILVYDAGVLEKVRNRQGEVVELWNRDPSTIIPMYDEHGVAGDPAYIQIVGPNPKPVAEWSNQDMIYMMMNPQGAIDRYGYGQSPIETAVMAITSSLMIDTYNSTYFDRNNIPPAIINLGEGVPDNMIKKFRSEWIATLRGGNNAWNNPIISAKNFDIKMLRPNQNEMQFMEFQMYLMKIIVAAFQMSPQDIGFTMDINKAVGEVQQNVSKNKGLMSLLALIREYINNEIIFDFGFDREFTFEWRDIDQIDKQVQAQIDIQYVNAGIKSRNEVRVRLGEEPVIGGERLSVTTASGPIYLDTTPLDGLSDKELAELRVVDDEDMDDAENEDNDKELDGKGDDKNKKADPKTAAPANNTKDDDTPQGNPKNEKKTAKSSKKKVLTPAIHAKQQDIEEKIQKLIQKRYKKLAAYYTKSLSKADDDTFDDPEDDISPDEYTDDQGNVKKEYFFIPLFYYEEVYKLGRANAIKLWNIENGSDELRQKDINKVTKMRDEAGSGVAERRTKGIQKILNDPKLSDEEKKTKIEGYIGVDRSQDTYAFPATAYAAYEMQSALNAGTLSAIEQYTDVTQVRVSNPSPCEEICEKFVAGGPYSIKDTGSLPQYHLHCRCEIIPV